MFYTIWVFTLNKQLILSDRFYGVYFTPKSKSEIKIADLTEAHNRNLRNLLAKYSAHICVQKLYLCVVATNYQCWLDIG